MISNTKHHLKLTYLSLKTKLLLVVSCAVILVGFCAILTMEYIRYERDQLTYDSVASALSYSVARIQDTLFSINTISNLILADRAIQENLDILVESTSSFERSQAMNELYFSLQNYASTSEYISTISISTEDIMISTIGNSLSSEWPHLQNQIMTDAVNMPEKISWYPSSLSDSTLLCTRNITKTKNGDLNSLWVLCIRVETENIVSNCNNFNNQFQDASFILVHQSTPIYATAPLFGADLYALLIRDRLSYYILELQGERYFTIIKTLDDFGWNYICCIPYDKVFDSVKFSSLLFFFIIIGSIGLTIGVSHFLIQAITKDFDLLIQKINSFKKNHLEFLPTPAYYSNKKSELALIHQQFDSMASEIIALIKDNYTKQLLIKDAKFKALEKQINPHFLYNTLESINWRAKAIGEKQISQMVEALANLLRTSLSEKADIIPLEKELEFIESYITIQKIRFDERLVYEVDITAPTKGLTIPKMSIQPLIENAIKYGVEQVTDSCTITLSIKVQDSLLLIQVKNSGSEFDTDLLNKLGTHKTEPHGFGLGLRNIDSRVKITYGDLYGLTLHNEEDMAIATLKLPLTSPTFSHTFNTKEER